MDLTLSIKQEIIRHTPEEKEVALYWYNRAKQTSDIELQEYYSNRAIFRGESIAKQEFEKARQKEVRSGTWNRDSGHAVAYIRKGAMGINSSMNGSSGNGIGSSDMGDGGEAMTFCDSNSSYEFMSDFNTRESDSSFEMFEMICKAIATKAEKLYGAWLMYTTGYDRVMEEHHWDFFAKEFNYLRDISKTYKDGTSKPANFADAWSQSESKFGLRISRQEFEKARDMFHSRCTSFANLD